MTLSEATVAIEQDLEAYYAFQFANGCLAWPNVPFTPPPVISGFFAGASPFWLKIDFVWGAGFHLTKDGRNTIRGILQLAYFTLKDGGDQFGAFGFLDGGRSRYNRLRLGTDIVFGVPSGPRWSFEDSWRVATLTAPFTLYEDTV